MYILANDMINELNKNKIQVQVHGYDIYVKNEGIHLSLSIIISLDSSQHQSNKSNFLTKSLDAVKNIGLENHQIEFFGENVLKDKINQSYDIINCG